MREPSRAVPDDRPREAVTQRYPSPEAEERFSTRCVQAAARLTVRHRSVPADLAFEARQLCDEGCELADRDLLPGAQVHRLGAVEVSCGTYEAFDAIVDVQKLPCRRPVAPELDRVPSSDHLADEVWNNVRVRLV